MYQAIFRTNFEPIRDISPLSENKLKRLQQIKAFKVRKAIFGSERLPWGVSIGCTNGITTTDQKQDLTIKERIERVLG
jgi:hypothetical protein